MASVWGLTSLPACCHSRCTSLHLLSPLAFAYGRALSRKRTQNHLNDLESRCEEKKSKIMQLQAQLRKAASTPAAAPAAAQLQQ